MSARPITISQGPNGKAQGGQAPRAEKPLAELLSPKRAKPTQKAPAADYPEEKLITSEDQEFVQARPWPKPLPADPWAEDDRDYIIVQGARQHNLKNLDLRIPRNSLTVVSGLSGSGKSSLAFDTIYAEGQRRYVESLSAYARQFLGQMDKPDVDLIEGLSPAISIEQKSVSKNPRSTVGTATEVYDYLRLLFARIGTPYCYKCGLPIMSQSPAEIVDRLLALPLGTKIMILAPLAEGRKGEHQKLFDSLRREGFTRVRIAGEILDLGQEIVLDKKKKHDIQ
ncbi:MAG: hypothetical protein LBE80_09640, partial [Deltaproteobacteria bacterium]|nr:hypothetical protein [Deltaproteobacteria bacterium]